MTERDTVILMYSAYRKAGMTDAGVWGMLGNGMCESTLIPYRLQGDFSSGLQKSLDYTRQVDSGAISRDEFVYHGPNGGGYGIFQFTFQTRKEGLYDAAKQTRRSIGDLSLQVDFSLQELKTDFISVWSVLSSTDSIKEASDIVCRVYEIPAIKNYDARYNAAISLRDKYADDVSGTPAELPHEQPATDDDGIEIPDTWPPRTIDRNCEGFPEIKLAQAALLCHGYSVLIDGIFGDSLYYKVKAFQAEHHLTADGVVGPLTWAALLET